MTHNGVSRVACWAIACLAAYSGPMVVVADARTATQSNRCNLLLAASLSPESIPEYMVWEHLFLGIATSDHDTLNTLSRLDDNSRNVLVAASAQVVNRTKQLRTAPQVTSLRDREVAAALAIRDARDELIRTLPEDVFSQVRQALSLRAIAKSAFTLPIEGTTSASRPQGRCQVDLSGRDYPHLVPESSVWEFYFEVRDITAQPYIVNGMYSREHIAFQAKRIGIPPSDAEFLLLKSHDTVTRVKELRDANAPETEVANVVLEARAVLLRSTPPNVWLRISRDAMSKASGTVRRIVSDY